MGKITLWALFGLALWAAEVCFVRIAETHKLAKQIAVDAAEARRQARAIDLLIAELMHGQGRIVALVEALHRERFPEQWDGSAAERMRKDLAEAGRRWGLSLGFRCQRLWCPAPAARSHLRVEISSRGPTALHYYWRPWRTLDFGPRKARGEAALRKSCSHSSWPIRLHRTGS